MSVTRQQRRQQLLNELESVRHLLQEHPPEAAAEIPTLNEPLEAIAPAPQLANSTKPVVIAASVSPAANTQQEQRKAAPTVPSRNPDAMQQLIAKLTQRQPQQSAASTRAPASDDAVSATPAAEPTKLAANPDTLLFKPAPPTASPVPAITAQTESTGELVFQAVTETPCFTQANFAPLELQTPSFSPIAEAELGVNSTAINGDVTLLDASSPIEANRSFSAEEVEQLLFELMPAIEELLREKLISALVPQPASPVAE